MGKQFLKVERFGSCARGGQNALADFVANSPEQAASHSRFLANVLDQESGRRFAVGAGDSGEFQFSRGEIVKSCGEIGHCAARIFDNDAGGAVMFFGALGDDHRGAFFNGLADEVVAIAFFAAQCHE
ncbi:MAG: hypothetical protein QOF93_1712 [Verrucomicrobiota bacterium]